MNDQKTRYSGNPMSEESLKEHLKAIPTADAAEVAVYVPSAAGLTAGTGSYTKETGTVTVSTDSYACYANGDFQVKTFSEKRADFSALFS